MPKNNNPDYDENNNKFVDPNVEAQYKAFVKQLTAREEEKTPTGPELSERDYLLLKGQAADKMIASLAAVLKKDLGQLEDGSIKPSHHEGANAVIDLVNNYQKMPRPFNAESLIMVAELEDKISASLYQSKIKCENENTSDKLKRKLSETMHPSGTTVSCIKAWNKIQPYEANWLWAELKKCEKKSENNNNAPK
jgi:hypothetical protein